MVYGIGEVIKTYRLEFGISQEELSNGICTPSNLSRIENNMQVPTWGTFEAMMQRLGKPVDLYAFLVDDEERRLQELCHDIRNFIICREYKSAEKLLMEMERKKNLGNIYQQFIYYVKAILLKNNGGSNEKVLELFYDALHITRKNADMKKINKILLTKDEITILNNIAIMKHKMGKQEEATGMLYDIKKYFEKKVVQGKENISTYTMILYNLSKWLALDKEYDEIIRLCDIGIESCKKYADLTYFPHLLFNKGYVLCESKNEEEDIQNIRSAYSILQILQSHELCSMIKKYMISKGYDLFI